MKQNSTWFSPRLEQETQLVRWGAVGTPVLIFPTAGGDAEEIERFLVIDCLSELLAAGRIKVYSCDSIAGRIMLRGDGSPQYQMTMFDRFQQYVRHEVVPAIRADCNSEDIEIVATGSSIGAFNALAVLCRYPDVFQAAVCLSGTYDLERFLKAAINHDFYLASPVHYLSGLTGSELEALQQRLVILASGEGRAENIGESWRVAHELGQKGVPNRVDSWGAEWHHDWVTWREMWPRYLDELTREPAGEEAGS